jgi:signal transduction histidine kinase
LRVTEEALTNVIKHSYAKKVLVRLYFSDIKQIILEIKDDGIGFNVDEISASNVNIGLKSMKIRLEKIQSTMNIYSRHGETIIKIIKNK